MMTDSSIWAALADSKRRQIINLLEEKPRTTSELCEFFTVSRFAIMKHLKVLEQAQLIQVRREGRNRWNILNDKLVHFLRTKISEDDNPSYQLTNILGLVPSQNAPPQNFFPSLCIEQHISLAVPPAQVFAALTANINAWWPQRSSANSQIILEPFVSGRFYEVINDAGQGVLYGTVTSITPDRELRLRATMELAELVTKTAVFDSFVHIGLAAKNGSTQLHLSHHLAHGVDNLAYAAGNQYWFDTLQQRFKPLVQKGIPYQHNP